MYGARNMRGISYITTMASMSKEEYLKKYLSEDQKNDARKKRRKKIKIATVKLQRSKIVDDDVDFKSLLPANLTNTLEDDVGDNDPTIADFIDERPEHVRIMEAYRQDKRWKILGNKKKRHDSDSEDDRLAISTRNQSDSDQSPPRKQRHDSDSDQSPPRRKRHDSNSDHSPTRRERPYSDSDQSPKRTKRHDSDSDQSPPRRNRHDSNSDQSPPKRNRHDSNSDQSPPRRNRHDSDSDQSPPRRKRHGSDFDQSPPRRKRHASDSDQSPPRRKSNSGSNKSPPRKKLQKSEAAYQRKESRGSKMRKSRWGSEESTSMKHETTENASGRAVKTLGGATAGLSSARQMKYEASQMKHREDEMFRTLDDEQLGKNAMTVFRESGRRRNLKEEKKLTAEEEAKLAEKQEKYKAWNKGLRQAEVQQRATEDAIHEINKPLTRTRDDADLDQALKEQDREGDPMLAFIKKKKTGKDSKKKELPRYKGPEPPPNRFSIWPGYRWDGVDRSNGFEQKVFAKVSEKKSIKEIAYKWSVEDM